MAKSPIEENMSYGRNAKIWRYMDLSKYLNLLSTSALYLPSLPAFEDAWEGATGVYAPDRDVTAIPAFLDRTPEADRQFIDSIEYGADMDRRSVYVSCWHANESESEAMWKLYGKSGGSIAIQTTIDRLETIGPPAESDGPSGIYCVRYRDLSRESMDVSDAFDGLARYTYKRPSFSHEREVRLIFRSLNFDEISTGPGKIDPRLWPWGRNFKVDLEDLVQKVVISPQSPAWFHDVVKDATKKYGFSFRVEGSEMNLRPTYGHLSHFRSQAGGNA